MRKVSEEGRDTDTTKKVQTGYASRQRTQDVLHTDRGICGGRNGESGRMNGKASVMRKCESSRGKSNDTSNAQTGYADRQTDKDTIYVETSKRTEVELEGQNGELGRMNRKASVMGKV